MSKTKSVKPSMQYSQWDSAKCVIAKQRDFCELFYLLWLSDNQKLIFN